MADQDIRLAAARARVEARRAGIIRPLNVRFCGWESCGKEFVARLKGQRFCSRDCGNKAGGIKRRRVRLPRICRRCGKSFIPDTSRQVNCSRSCYIGMTSRICANLECGKSFVGNKQFCSMRCASYFYDKKKGKNRIPFVGEGAKRDCIACKADISHRHINSVYCSKKCQLEYTREVRNAKRRDYEKTPEFRIKRKEYYLKSNKREYNTAYQKKHRDRYRVLAFNARIKRDHGYDLKDLPPKPSKCENPFCKGVKIVFEHNHKTGAFRGWVCQRCNSVMGNALDSPAYLRWLADYLETRG